MSDTHGSRAELTVAVVAAYVSRNAVPMAELPGLIRRVDEAIRGVGSDAAPETAPAAAPRTPAVPVDQSVHDDFLVCLEDGVRKKSLKRYLRAQFNLSPEQYRERWNLPRDYPMVAPGYARVRSDLAKSIGLGRPGSLARQDAAPTPLRAAARSGRADPTRRAA